MNASGADSNGLDGVDREIRIEKLRREIEQVAGEGFISGRSADCDPAIEEAFLEHVLALETQGFSKPFDVLLKDGFSLSVPDELDDAALTTKLWQLIRALGRYRFYLHCTDHLSDRELYGWLWRDALRQEVMGFGLPFGSCHLDVLGGCSDEDLTLQMRYYADDDQRARWAAEFPDFPMPLKETPRFGRDRHLPRPRD